MKEFDKISPLDINDNMIKLLCKDWTLITTKNDVKTNAMTASWGGFGELWGKHVAYVVIRPSRYTYNTMETNNDFSLCFFEEKYRNELSYFGKKSGRDTDKIKDMKFSVEDYDGCSVINEARLALICNKLYSQPFERKFFTDNDFARGVYPDDDIHKLYIAEIKYALLHK